MVKGANMLGITLAMPTKILEAGDPIRMASSVAKTGTNILAIVVEVVAMDATSGRGCPSVSIVTLSTNTSGSFNRAGYLGRRGVWALIV